LCLYVVLDTLKIQLRKHNTLKKTQVRSQSCLSNVERRLLRTVTDLSVQKLLSTTPSPDKEVEKKRLSDKSKGGVDDSVVSYVQTPMEASDSQHFKPESNTSQSEAGALHAAKSLQSFLSSDLVTKMKKRYGEYNSEYWSTWCSSVSSLTHEFKNELSECQLSHTLI
jgi:hypothetical protein